MKPFNEEVNLEELKVDIFKRLIYPMIDKYLDLINTIKKAKTKKEIDDSMAKFIKENS